MMNLTRIAIESLVSGDPSYRALEVRLQEGTSTERWLQVDTGDGEFIPVPPEGQIYEKDGQEIVHRVAPEWVTALHEVMISLPTH